MPNTDPATDSRDVVDYVRNQGRRAGLCDVYPSGCITVGRAGEQLAPFGELVAAGVRIFTDDGTGVQDPLLMRRAMEYSLGLDMVLAQHCEVAALTKGAVMHEGHCCSELGVPGWPSIAEELMVHRDIELSRLTGARIHILHLSTAGSVELVRRAKADGLPVTAEAAPHHISLTDEQLRGYDPVFKVNPPLRTKADIEAIVGGLARRHDRRHRHRPRPAPGRPQGAPARRGAARDGRTGDRARRVPADPHRRRDVAGRRRGGVHVEAGGDRRALGRPRRADRGRGTGEPRRVRPDRRVAGRAGEARQPQPQHARTSDATSAAECDTRCWTAPRP